MTGEEYILTNQQTHRHHFRVAVQYLTVVVCLDTANQCVHLSPLTRDNARM
jgi:hypothetical protein